MLPKGQKQTVFALRNRVDAASQVTPELFSAVAATVGIGLEQFGAPRDAARVLSLAKAKAWTEAALALIEIALPHWKLTRLTLDDGGWSCRLSKHWQIPDWLDDLVEATHEILPLAVLTALLEAYQASSKPTGSAVVPRIKARWNMITNSALCDNFM